MKHQVELSTETIAHLGRISMGDLNVFPEDVATEICLLMRNLAKDKAKAQEIRQEFCLESIRLVGGDCAKLLDKIRTKSEINHNTPDDHARELFNLMTSDVYNNGR